MIIMKKILITNLILALFLVIPFVYSDTPCNITSCQKDIEMNSGDISQVSFDVKNIGKGDGRFEGNLICNNNPQPLNTRNILVNKDSTESFTGQIQLTTGKEDITNKCVFEVTDVNGGGTDTCSFNVKVKAIKGCTTNICSSDFSSILECQDDGTYKEIKCEFACELTPTGAQCKDSDYKNNNIIFYSIIGLLLLLIVLFLIFKKRK